MWRCELEACLACYLVCISGGIIDRSDDFTNGESKIAQDSDQAALKNALDRKRCAKHDLELN